MTEPPTQTAVLLQRWHEGDREALNELVARDQEWIRQRAHRRIGHPLRRRFDTDDIVVESMERAMRRKVTFTISDKQVFRAILAVLVENTIRDLIAEHTCQKRDVDRERPLPVESILNLESDRSRKQARPSQIAHQNEISYWVELAVELLDTMDRRVVELKLWNDLTFPQISERLDISPDAARMRFQRSLTRLADFAEGLENGRVIEVLKEAEAGRTG